MGAHRRRAGDPYDLDPRSMRGAPLAITVNREDLADAIAAGQRRALKVGATAAVITAIIVSALAGLVVTGVVTSTVRHDVGKAAVFNCQRTNRAATVGPALRSFLTTDAAFNAQLAALDRRSARIDRNLSREIRLLGPALPPDIAKDYFAQSNVFQRLAVLRAQVANLWAGTPVPGNHAKHRRRAPSLSRDVLTITQAHCDQILLP